MCSCNSVKCSFAVRSFHRAVDGGRWETHCLFRLSVYPGGYSNSGSGFYNPGTLVFPSSYNGPSSSTSNNFGNYFLV